MTTHTGSCHCGAIRFEFDADVKDGVVCNCSHCHRKGFVLLAVPKEHFRLASGAEAQTEYQFNTKAIRHLFCRICGVQPYAESAAYPSLMVNLRCVDGVDIDALAITKYEGKDI